MKNKYLIYTMSAFLLSSFVNADSLTYKAKIPTSLLTPDKVETEYLGTLNFQDGFPTQETVTKSYDLIFI